MPEFLLENKERWEHWLNRFMQKKLLGELISLIPKETFRLDLKFYSKIFEHFLDIKDFKSFLQALNSFPTYLINQDHLLDLIKKLIENDKDLASND